MQFEARDHNFKKKIYELFEEYEDREIKVTPEFIEELRKEAKRQRAEEKAKVRLQVIQDQELSMEMFELEDIPSEFEVFDEEE